MMVEDFSESGHAVREARTQTYPSVWESLTLHNIVALVATALELRMDESFWLDRLEKFFLAI